MPHQERFNALSSEAELLFALCVARWVGLNSPSYSGVGSSGKPCAVQSDMEKPSASRLT